MGLGPGGGGCARVRTCRVLGTMGVCSMKPGREWKGVTLSCGPNAVWAAHMECVGTWSVALENAACPIMDLCPCGIHKHLPLGPSTAPRMQGMFLQTQMRFLCVNPVVFL